MENFKFCKQIILSILSPRYMIISLITLLLYLFLVLNISFNKYINIFYSLIFLLFSNKALNLVKNKLKKIK